MPASNAGPCARIAMRLFLVTWLDEGKQNDHVASCSTGYRLQMSILADRVWYAIHCLARQPDGSAPTYLDLEHRAGLPNAFFSKMVRGNRPAPSPKTMACLAVVLGVDLLWLSTGDGLAPSLTGELPPRPGASAVPAWKPDHCRCPPSLPSHVNPEPPSLPARNRAAIFAAEDGVSQVAIQRVLAYQYPYGADPSKLTASEWLDRMREADREILAVLHSSRAT